MPSILPTKRLLRLSVAVNKAIRYHKEGVSLENDSNRTIDEILLKVAADRWRFAAQQRTAGNKLINTTPPLYRSAISRYY
jgi:hypothetical protein